MIEKVQRDIINLCYLGLHQYAKENKLIGRSRPLLSEGMTPYYIRRLFFRLTVACIKQMIDTINWSHGDRLEQVNYINVGGYTTLRLYGLLDREMFIVQRDKSYPLWQGLIPSEDWVHLSQERPIEEVREFLSLPTRAVLEVGGERFTNMLRSAMQYIRTEEDVKLHIQYEPKDRGKVRNIAIDLELYELPYIGRGRGWERAHAIPAHGHAGRVEVPCHIEKIIHFRNNVYPFVNNLTDTKVREDFMYLTENWPSGDAIQIKHRQLQMSQEERERRERQETEEVEAHEGQLEAIRERFRVAFGDQRPEATVTDMQEALVEAGANPVPDDGVTTPANEQIPDPAPEICDLCNGNWDDCDCCGECNSTADDCQCWQCDECGEHEDDCVCCGECNLRDCRCPPEREAALVEPADSADEQKQREIEQLRQRVSNVLGD
jgi:hypothetical protein